MKGSFKPLSNRAILSSHSWQCLLAPLLTHISKPQLFYFSLHFSLTCPDIIPSHLYSFQNIRLFPPLSKEHRSCLDLVISWPSSPCSSSSITPWGSSIIFIALLPTLTYLSPYLLLGESRTVLNILGAVPHQSLMGEADDSSGGISPLWQGVEGRGCFVPLCRAANTFATCHLSKHAEMNGAQFFLESFSPFGRSELNTS